MTRAMVVAAVIAAVFAACFSKPDRPGVTTDARPGDARFLDSPGGPMDTMIDAPMLGLCANGMSPVIFDSFSGTGSDVLSACGSGATGSTTNMSITRNGGLLKFTPTMGGVSGGGQCTWDPLPANTGIVAQWSMIAAPNLNDVVELDGFTNDYEADLSLVNGPTMSFDGSGSSYGTKPFDAADVWWRIRQNGSGISAEYSIDGNSWSMVGSADPVTGESLSKLTVDYQSDASTSRTLELDTLYVCP